MSKDGGRADKYAGDTRALVGRKDKRRVDAIVRLFGGLSYFVNLADNYDGADFYRTLVYDAQKGEERRTIVLNEQSEFLQVEQVTSSKDTIWNDRVKAGEFFLRFLDEAIQANLKARQAAGQKGQSELSGENRTELNRRSPVRVSPASASNECFRHAHK